MKLTKETAYSLLTEGLEEPEKLGYVSHSRYVGELAGMIAGGLGLDPEYAAVLGFIHDVGRKVDPGNHMYAGYRFLKDNGYGEYAFICLTHSFLNNDIECICGEQLSPDSEGYEEVRAFVESQPYTDYDRIIQTCDLLCLHTGGTTLEERIDDIEARKGTHAKSGYHRETASAQKAEIESRLGHSVYDFYNKLNNAQERKTVMKKVLVVVDMQNDFVDGALGSPEAAAIVPNVAKKIREFDGDELFVTYDTHYDNYMQTLEGKRLPVPHCIDGTSGHDLNPVIKAALAGKEYRDVIKAGFGSFSLTKGLKDRYPGEEIEAEFVGLCTDICVVSNVLIMRAAYPNAVITVDSSCCAGVTPEKHEAALETMRSCQIDVI